MAKRGGFPGGGMPGNMANLMKQAQKMQRQMEEQAKEMETKEFTATAGGGAVEVTVSGSKKLVKVKSCKKMGITDFTGFLTGITRCAKVLKAIIVQVILEMDIELIMHVP